MVHELINIIDTATRFPANLVLSSNSRLLALCPNLKFIAKTPKERLLGELIFRWYFFKRFISTNEFERYIAEHFSVDTLANFRNLPSIKESSPLSRDELSSIFSEVPRETLSIFHQRWNTFYESDGIIPLMDMTDDEAVPLPFKILENVEEFNHKLIIRDLDNNEIPEWKDYLNNISTFIDSNWKIVLQISNADTLPLQGDSLALPLLLAVARKKEILSYNPLDILATGALDVAGQLKSIDALQAKQRLGENIGVSIFFAPGDDTANKHSTVSMIPLGTPCDKIPSIVRETLLDADLCKLDWRQAVKTLKELSNSVHYGIIPLEKVAIPRLDRIDKALRSNDCEENLLESTALRSTIYCHMGKTLEAKKLIEKCETRISRGGSYDLLRRTIEQLVILTDLGDFCKILEMEKYLIDKIYKAEIKKREKNDLRMRLFGTLGQAYLYQSLPVGSNEAASLKSLDYFNKAVECANSHQVESEIAQDLNYVHLWHALNAYGTPEELTAYTRAEHAALKSKSSIRNLSYLYRQKAFGAYYDYLSNNRIAEITMRAPDTRNAEGWTSAMYLKYLGALKAAQNQFKTAKEDFELALELLNKNELPLLYLLKMTIAVQAWNSLKKTEFAEFAEECYQKALSFFSDFSVLETYTYAKEWETYLKKRGKEVENPQLKFQY